MIARLAGVIVAVIACCGCTASRTGTAEQVRATEIAFAQSMADRNFTAFMAHVSRDAVFIGEKTTEHGQAEVGAAWKPYFTAPKAPFAWAPDHVEVVPSGQLALSTGPVTINGTVVGRFNSVWRLEPDGQWRIVFDKGDAQCASAP